MVLIFSSANHKNTTQLKNTDTQNKRAKQTSIMQAAEEVNMLKEGLKAVQQELGLLRAQTRDAHYRGMILREEIETLRSKVGKSIAGVSKVQLPREVHCASITRSANEKGLHNCTLFVLEVSKGDTFDFFSAFDLHEQRPVPNGKGTNKQWRASVGAFGYEIGGAMVLNVGHKSNGRFRPLYPAIKKVGQTTFTTFPGVLQHGAKAPVNQPTTLTQLRSPEFKCMTVCEWMLITLIKGGTHDGVVRGHHFPLLSFLTEKRARDEQVSSSSSAAGAKKQKQKQ